MTLLQAILLGIVQGLTEFIPISSTAHLVLASRVMKLALSPEQLTSSIAVVQLGTLIAVLIYFARDIWNISVAFIRDHLALLSKKNAGGRGLSHEAKLGWPVVIGSLPVAIVGLLFKKQIEGTFTKNLWVIATMMVVIALLLALAEVVGKKQREMKDLTVKDALAVGFAQCLALIPGSSRSGSTIMGGLFAGEARDTAARFSFLLSIPAIAQRSAGNERGPAQTAARKPHDTRRGHVSLRHCWLPVDLVPASFPAHAHDWDLHCIQTGGRWRDINLAVDWKNCCVIDLPRPRAFNFDQAIANTTSTRRK